MTDSIFYTAMPLQRQAPPNCGESWFEKKIHEKNTRIAPLWRNRNLILPGDDPTSVSITGNHARGLLQIAGERIFLGLEPEKETGEHIAHFAIDLSNHELPTLSPFLGRAEFIDLRQVGPALPHHEGALLALARGALYWHRHNQYCSNCGSETHAEKGGRLRKCRNLSCEREHFPRTDPAVIMLVTRPGPEGGACLLGRHENLPQGIYSTLAGFVDQGESLEEAVAREVKEEAGIDVTDIQYRGSQPWPFPSSLMMGFRARAINVNIDLGHDELEDAGWYTRDQIRNFPATGKRLPRVDSIAHTLVREWMEEG